MEPSAVGACDVLVVDAANVVGSRPDGWWKDRPGAAARLHASLVGTRALAPHIVLVLEGRARAGVPETASGDVEVVHAAADGDRRIVEEARRALTAGQTVTVVTADRVLGEQVLGLGAQVLGPGWLLDRL